MFVFFGFQPMRFVCGIRAVHIFLFSISKFFFSKCLNSSGFNRCDLYIACELYILYFQKMFFQKCSNSSGFNRCYFYYLRACVSRAFEWCSVTMPKMALDSAARRVMVDLLLIIVQSLLGQEAQRHFDSATIAKEQWFGISCSQHKKMELEA